MWFHWLIGTYWERTRDDINSYYAIPALKPSGDAFQYYASYYGVTQPPRPGEWYGYTERNDYLQATEFLNMTFDLTKRLKLELGAVHFESHFNAIVHGGYLSYAPENVVSEGPGGSEKWNFRGGMNYKATDDLLLYIDAAQGFRDGGVNPGLPAQCTKNGVPTTFKPDTLTNIGAVLAGRVGGGRAFSLAGHPHLGMGLRAFSMERKDRLLGRLRRGDNWRGRADDRCGGARDRRRRRRGGFFLRRRRGCSVGHQRVLLRARCQQVGAARQQCDDGHSGAGVERGVRATPAGRLAAHQHRVAHQWRVALLERRIDGDGLARGRVGGVFLGDLGHGGFSDGGCLPRTNSHNGSQDVQFRFQSAAEMKTIYSKDLSFQEATGKELMGSSLHFTRVER